MDTPNRQIVNRLDTAKEVRVVDWLRAHQAALLDDRPPLPDLAARLAAELGFPVHATQAARLRDVIGLHWSPRITRRKKGARRTLARLAHVEKVVKDICDGLSIAWVPLDVEGGAE